MTQKNYLNWYYNEFIQVYTFKDGDNTNLLLYSYGIQDGIGGEYESLEYVKGSNSRIKIGNDIVDLCKVMINNEYYIYVYCDDSYVSTMNVNYHRYHDILIYGYDDQTQSFDVFAYNGSKLKRFMVSYNDFISAYHSKYTDRFDNYICFCKKRENYDFSINTEKIRWHILDYLDGVDTLRRERPLLLSPQKATWGINTYDEIINMYEKSFQQQKLIRMPEIYCFMEHKKDWLNRIVYFKEQNLLNFNDGIYDNFVELKNCAEVIVNLTIKFNLKIENNICDKKLLNKLLYAFQNCLELDKTALMLYYNHNKQIFNNL